MKLRFAMGAPLCGKSAWKKGPVPGAEFFTAPGAPPQTVVDSADVDYAYFIHPQEYQVLLLVDRQQSKAWLYEWWH